MQIYLRGGCLHGFNRQKAFGAEYMTGNPWASQGHGEYDENNMGHGNKSSTKG